MAVILSNNATSLLAGNITVSSTTISVTASDAGKFPSPSSDQWFPITIVDASGNMEIMKATKRVGAVITVERAQEGTTAKAFTSGARVDSRLTAAAIFDLVTSETIAKNIQKVTESESVIDTDILAGTDKNGDFLKKWSFAKIKTWIQGWIEAKDVGLDKVPNKTEAEMVASGAIKDELAKRPTVNSTTGRLPVNMIPHLIGADGDGYVRLCNSIDGRGLNTELRIYTNGGGQIIHNDQGILAFGTDGFASVYKNPTSNNHVANKAYVDIKKRCTHSGATVEFGKVDGGTLDVPVNYVVTGFRQQSGTTSVTNMYVRGKYLER